MSKNGMIYIETEKNGKKKFLYIGIVLAVVAFAAVVLLVVPSITGGMSVLTGNKSVTTELPDPVQKKADGVVKLKTGNYDVTITKEYSYVADALVVHTKNYYGSSVGNQLAPRDFALAWGKLPMYNDKIDFHWSQSGRWYSWTLKSNEEAEEAGGIDYINQHSANTHILPADDTVKKAVKSVRTGDHVVLTGYLVSVYAVNNAGETFTWNSSTTRTDTGDGACEVMYVTDVEIM